MLTQIVVVVALVAAAYAGSYSNSGLGGWGGGGLGGWGGNGGGWGGNSGWGGNGGNGGGWGGGHGGHSYDYHARPHYKFDYGVSDHHTGDQKQQSEMRDGHVTKGQFSIHDPHGWYQSQQYVRAVHGGY